ncbi:hypothetical protein JR316_0004035 [Psilocybe cubensis]|uniref:Uncharacterized protein n=2 Tax=Psilocybe cubensis TaxID=181762 RepID=A0A8H7Y1H9_PSICU|nr:hypothetical protein JR316_0004035 [Psilocybe cubensis]KAH9484553.1 hypothetical protein JR316_0004035 [Psilocybe cubensis]
MYSDSTSVQVENEDRAYRAADSDSAHKADSEDTLSDRSISVSFQKQLDCIPELCILGFISHPYRAYLEDTSFARCHQTSITTCGAETYTRSLLMAGHGTPIWDPIGDTNRPKHHLKSGVMIGDVGHVTVHGDFESYFNIFLPPDKELQLYCPENLEPLSPPLKPEEVKVQTNYFHPGTVLSSTGAEVTHMQESPLDLKFTIKARESGILILPDGASRTDLLPSSTTRIRDYVHKHAFEWYKFINGTKGLVICPNGSLCVVTGHDKAASWASCTSNPIDHLKAAESGSVIVDGEHA